MILRVATPNDIPELVKLFRMFAQSSPLVSTFGEDDPVATAGFAASLTMGENFATVAELPEAPGTLVGAIAVEVYQLSMFPTLLARDLFVYAHPSYRGLWMRRIFDLTVREARARKVEVCFFHCIAADPEHNARNTEFLEMSGFAPLGQVLMKRL